MEPTEYNRTAADSERSASRETSPAFELRQANEFAERYLEFAPPSARARKKRARADKLLSAVVFATLAAVVAGVLAPSAPTDAPEAVQSPLSAVDEAD